MTRWDPNSKTVITHWKTTHPVTEPKEYTLTSPQFRAALRGTIAALGLAVAATVSFVAPGLPDQIMVAWGAVVMAGFGAMEAFYDARHKEAGNE